MKGIRAPIGLLAIFVLSCNTASSSANQPAQQQQEQQPTQPTPSIAAKSDEIPQGESDIRANDEEISIEDAKKILLQDARKKQSQIADSQIELDKKKAELELFQKMLDQKLSTIEDLEKRLDQKLGLGKVAKERREERIQGLANLISTMSPQSGSEVLAKMNDSDAQEILATIAQKNERKAAKLLSLIPAERSAKIGQLFLSRDTAQPSENSPKTEEPSPK